MGVKHILVAVSLIFLIYGVVSDICEKNNNCSACIKDASVCVWCAMDNFNDSRCKLATKYTEDWCPDSLQNPQVTAEPTNIKNFSSNLGQVIQIKPQKYKLNLRPGIAANFTFSYQPASDYPVDLYFLFDTSKTMTLVKSIIETQSKSIYDTMHNLTKNIQLGMGSFVDKNTLPYTDIINSENTYSFRNRLKLQDNPVLFKDIINGTQFGYNVDEPEGGLDALAQVISCGKDQIGWRNESRKLVIFLTDGPYHVAGDGMIGGIFKPYDGGCYTNEAGIYTKELDMDYPSPGIINKLAVDNEIAIVFAVNSTVQTIYSHLSQAISGSRIETYDGGNDNIANIITDIYKNIARKIKIKVNFKSGHRSKFEIKFNPDCTLDTNNLECALKEGEEKTITGTIKVSEYLGVDSTSVDILIEGIKEKLTLDINFINCPCASAAKNNSAECNNGGTRKCGICECNDNRYGMNCACIKNSASRANDNSTCIMPGDTKECSGHGSCICGNCICRKQSPYEGQYCQFNKDNCPRSNNAVCNGHGRCENEACICDEEWSGPACECPKSNVTCIGNNGKVCNGMGDCVCGKCTCHPTPEWNARTNRDSSCRPLSCRDCHIPQCKRLQPCALCRHSEENCPQCQPFDVNVDEDFASKDNTSWNLCPDISGNIGCYFKYMYRYTEDDRIELVVQEQEDCLKSYYKFGGIAVAVLILLGLVGVLAWKWVTTVRDRREYHRFRRAHEADSAPVHANPCYRPAATTVTNPAYRKRSVDYRN